LTGQIEMVGGPDTDRGPFGHPWPIILRFLQSRQNPYLSGKIRVWL